MSILRRPGFADYVLNEGRIHTDILKKRISDVLDRQSLGKSPAYVVQKIAEELKLKYGENFDLSTLKTDDILKTANLPYVTRGLFEPKLREVEQPQAQSQQIQAQQTDVSSETEKDFTDDIISNYLDSQGEEDSQEQDYQYSDSQFDSQELAMTAAESVKLSKKQTAQVLNEQYKKRMQKLYSIEQRYSQ